MGGNIHSVQFYDIIAKSRADGNRDGVIDRKEASLYNAWMEYFNRDNKPEITEEDVAVYRKEVTYTPEEKEILKQVNKLMIRDDLTYDESRLLSELDDQISLQKRHDVNSFSGKVLDAIDYLNELQENGNLEKLGISTNDIDAFKNAYQQEYNIDING